jgi:prepilin-type N-terminal cleavage/methylation domain-containing protein
MCSVQTCRLEHDGNRRGLTLIELMVALLISSVGVGAVISSSVFVTRLVGAAFRATEVAELAAGQFEILASAVPCVSEQGETVRGPYTVRWTVTPDDRTQRVTVIVVSPRAVRADTFAVVTLC